MVDLAQQTSQNRAQHPLDDAPPAPAVRRRSGRLLNQAQVRKFILDTIRQLRPHLRITQVSQQALDQLEGYLREKIRSAVSSHPTVGRTFKP